MKYLINTKESNFINVVLQYRKRIVTTIPVPIYTECQYKYQRGESRGKLCLESTIAGMKYCERCSRKTSSCKDTLATLKNDLIVFENDIRNEFYKRVLYHYVLINNIKRPSTFVS